MLVVLLKSLQRFCRLLLGSMGGRGDVWGGCARQLITIAAHSVNGEAQTYYRETNTPRALIIGIGFWGESVLE